MASIREYRSKRTNEVTYQLLFRQGGVQKSRTFTSKRAAGEARVLVETFGADRGLAMLAEQSEPVGLTVKDLAEEWLTWKARDVEPRTIADYRRDYENWIDPFFGHRSAARVTESDVQDWVDKNLTGRLGPKSIADKHAIMHGIYKWGSSKSRAKVPANPCAGTELPKRRKGAPKGLTLPEWYALVEASRHKSVGEDAADLILFLGSTGWRLGEATALTVRNVEEDGEGVVWVTMSQVARKGEGLTMGGKSQAAMRRIDVPSDCARMLRRRVTGKGPGDLVFTNRASPTGVWEPSAFRKRYWSRAVKLAGLADRKPTPHWTRHSHVAMCLAAGMGLHEIQRRIGHADIQTTINVYGRMAAEVSPQVRSRLDGIVSGSGLQVVEGKVVPSLPPSEGPQN